MSPTATQTRVWLDGEWIVVEDFDYDFIYDAIRWARQDEAWLASLSQADLIRWGNWEQGAWATLRAPFELREQMEDARGRIDLDTLTERIRSGECQTAYCMAGQRVNQAGYRMVFDPSMIFDDSGDTANFCIQQEPTQERDNNNRVIWKDVEDAEMVSISQTAQQLMGITVFESGLFFESDNGPDYLAELANGMCRRRGIPLMFPDNETYNMSSAYEDEHDDDEPSF